MKRLVFCFALAGSLSALAADLRLSLQAYTFRDRSFVETVETAARLGYTNIEAYPGQRLGGGMEGSTDYHMKPETFAQLKEYLAKAPVKVVSYGVTGAGGDDEWRRLLTFCRDLGIEIVQIEVGPDHNRLVHIASLAKEYGVRVGLHNHRQESGRPEKVLAALGDCDPIVGSSADIGHWHNSGVDPVEGVKALKGRFHSIHAIDSSAKQGGKDVALGSGVMDVKGVLDLLKENEKGVVYVTVEDEWQHADLEEAVAASARWFKAWERGELTPCGRIGVSSIDSLWKDVDGKNPLLWDVSIVGGENIEEKVSQMRKIGLEEGSLKSDEKGMNDREDVASAFAGEDAKFCRPWKEKAYVSCRTMFLVAANYYTIASANDDPGRDPVSWVLYGSKDGGPWVELDRRENQKFPLRKQLRGYEIKNPQMSRDYKIEFLKNNGGKLVQFSRVAFYE